METQTLITDIDNFLEKIVKKISNSSSDRGDILIILMLQLTKLQLVTTNKIDDNTVRGINAISARDSHYYLFHDFRELYDELQNLIKKMYPFNKRFLDADLTIVGIESEKWVSCVANITKKILSDNIM